MPKPQGGFTLVEIAISFLIIALLLGGALMTLGAQSDIRAVAETQRTLQQAQEALLGFAIANGRLPCPALAIGSKVDWGKESLDGTNCAAVSNESFFPARTLGISPTDEFGFLVDAWGTRVLYYTTVRTAQMSPPPPSPEVTYDRLFTNSDPDKQLRNYVSNVADGYKRVATPPDSGLNTHITVCSKFLTPPSPAPQCSETLSNNAIAIFISRGPNYATGGAGDEAENLNGGINRVFISHTPDPNFDDIVTWLSPYTLYNRMIAAGAL